MFVQELQWGGVASVGIQIGVTGSIWGSKIKSNLVNLSIVECRNFSDKLE